MHPRTEHNSTSVKVERALPAQRAWGLSAGLRHFSRESGYARAHEGMEWGRPLVRNYCTHSRRVLLDITLRKYRLSWGVNPCLRAEAPYLICLRSLCRACPKAFPNKTELAWENLEDARLPFVRITHARGKLACRTARDAAPLS